jgi:predicted amidohydrolase
MRVSVCELSNDSNELERDWRALVAHVKSQASDLVLLPEMPFHAWLAQTRQVDPQRWQASVAAHDRWLRRLEELGPTIVVGTRPVTQDGKRLNAGFIWDKGTGYRAVHHKYYLPDEPGFWEATWYDRGSGDFAVADRGAARIGFLICTELWFTAHARDYAKQGVSLLVCPRATPLASAGKWVAGGRVAAVISGAFCLSSNFNGGDENGIAWGGHSWIIEPEEGQVLGVTSRERPFLTLEIDLATARAAKKTYPRYVLD